MIITMTGVEVEDIRIMVMILEGMTEGILMTGHNIMRGHTGMKVPEGIMIVMVIMTFILLHVALPQLMFLLYPGTKEHHQKFYPPGLST